MTDRENDVVLYEVQDTIARINLNRPEKRNALNEQLVAELKQALRRANDDQEVRVILLSGAGSDFCSGADLAALQEMSSASVSENLDDARGLMELFGLMRQVRMPVIAAVRGRALAGGCGLALACDMVLAEKSARFGFPEVKIGFVPAMVMAILRRNVSEKKAFELIALGEQLTATKAESLNLINLVFADSDFDTNVEALTLRLAKLNTSALGLAKALLYQIDSLSFLEALESGLDINVIARSTEGFRAGINAFLKGG